MRHQLTAQFLERYPHLSGYTFLSVVEDYVRVLNERNVIPTTSEAVMAEALRNPFVEQVLVGVTEVRQNIQATEDESPEYLAHLEDQAQEDMYVREVMEY